MSLADIVTGAGTVQELPRGWDIGGGEGLAGKGCDGPLWITGAGLVYSDAGHSRWLRWRPGDAGVSVVQQPTGKAVGSARDATGRVVACQFETRSVVRIELDGSTTVLAGGDGSLAGPDDVAIGGDGSVWFTDVRPLLAPPDAPASAVYRIRDDGAVERVVDTLNLPGGLAFSPAGDVLYLSEMTTRALHALDVADGSIRQLAEIDGALIEGLAPIATQTMPQGLAVDERGNIYAAGPGGIWVTASDGAHVGVIRHPATSTTNLAFGGEEGRTLFFTTNVAAGFVDLAVRGAQLPGDATGNVPATWQDPTPLENHRRIDRIDPRLDAVIAPGTEIEELGSGGVFDDLGGGPHSLFARSLEGTVWDSASGHLFFSDIGNDRRLTWTPDDGFAVLHPHTNHTNGATLDQAGAIVSAEHSTRRISRLSRDGTYTVVVDRHAGGRLGRCNDVVVRSDGNIYFTTPWWDFGSGDTSEQPYSCWAHRALDGSVTLGPGGYRVPNGLAFTPDERVLYVNDSYGPNIKAYDVAPDGAVDIASERVFFQFHGDGHGTPDGMKVDTAGNVYCGGPGGLWVISPEGEHLGTIVHDSTQINNLAFGGPDRTTLYFVSWSAVFRIQLRIAGLPVPSTPFPS